MDIRVNYQSIILAFLWLAGTIKPYLYTYLFELDITLYMMVIALADIFISGGIKRIRPGHYSYKLFYVVLLIFLWIFLSNIYTESRNYGVEKTVNFAGNLIFFMYPLFIKRIDFDTIIKTYIIVLLPIAVFFVYMMSIVWSSDSFTASAFMNIRNSYLSLGFNLGVFFIILNYFKRSIWLQLLVFFLLVASSARGPLVFALIVFIFLNYKNFPQYLRNKKMSLKLVVLIIGLLCTSLLFSDYITPLLSATIRRFTSLTSGDDVSALTRFTMIEYAFFQPFQNNESLLTLIFGNGIGSFGIMFSGSDEKLYPHNLFIEVLFELGIIGLILFIVMFWIAFRKLSLRSSVFSALFLFSFMNAMKSSSMTDLWIFFSFLAGVTLDYNSFENKKELNVTNE